MTPYTPLNIANIHNINLIPATKTKTPLFYLDKWLHLLLYRIQPHSLEDGDEVSPLPPTQRIDKNISGLKSPIPNIILREQYMQCTWKKKHFAGLINTIGIGFGGRWQLQWASVMSMYYKTYFLTIYYETFGQLSAIWWALAMCSFVNKTWKGRVRKWPLQWICMQYVYWWPVFCDIFYDEDILEYLATTKICNCSQAMGQEISQTNTRHKI